MNVVYVQLLQIEILLLMFVSVKMESDKTATILYDAVMDVQKLHLEQVRLNKVIQTKKDNLFGKAQRWKTARIELGRMRNDKERGVKLTEMKKKIEQLERDNLEYEAKTLKTEYVHLMCSPKKYDKESMSKQEDKVECFRAEVKEVERELFELDKALGDLTVKIKAAEQRENRLKSAMKRKIAQGYSPQTKVAKAECNNDKSKAIRNLTSMFDDDDDDALVAAAAAIEQSLTDDPGNSNDKCASEKSSIDEDELLLKSVDELLGNSDNNDDNVDDKTLVECTETIEATSGISNVTNRDRVTISEALDIIGSDEETYVIPDTQVEESSTKNKKVTTLQKDNFMQSDVSAFKNLCS